MPAPAERGAALARPRASRWPDAAWAAFAAGNLAWMALMPHWAVLPFHAIWISLLLSYGVGYRTASPALVWRLFVPVMALALLLSVIDWVRTSAPFSDLTELLVPAVLLFAIVRLTIRRKAAMAALGEAARRNAELVQRQRAFVRNASHELRTPITVALAHAELLPGPPGDTARAAKDAAIVTDELGRLNRLVDRLLQLAAAEHPASLRLAPVRLGALPGDLMRRWEAVPRRWLAAADAAVTVLADRDRLLAALDGVIDNAVRFTGVGDTIEISVRQRDGQAAITVADSGPGIPDSLLEAVFDRFDAVDPRRDRARHFGLGLPIARAVAEAHGGQASAARSALGGAAVTLLLPLHHAPAGHQEPRCQEQSASSSPTSRS